MNAVFWEVAPYGSSKNQRFGGMCRLHLQGKQTVSKHLTLFSLAYFSTLKMEATRSSEALALARSTRRHIPEDGILLIPDYNKSVTFTDETYLISPPSPFHFHLYEGSNDFQGLSRSYYEYLFFRQKCNHYETSINYSRLRPLVEAGSCTLQFEVLTKRVRWIHEAFGLYSEVQGFESRPGDWISSLRCFRYSSIIVPSIKFK
jgi:hypothetical protein